jgi:hypothetical protein
MQTIRWLLLVLLGLTAVMHFIEGIAAIADPAGMMTGLNLAMSPGMEVPITFLGLAMIVRAAISGIALGWIVQHKPEGLFLARFVAFTILLSAPVVYLRLRRPEFAVADLLHGLLLLGPTMVLKPHGDA